MPTPELLLVDASPYLFRAHFALPSSIVDREGRPANAVYGFMTFLLKLLAEERPTHLAIAFDASLTTSFRNRLYADYKAQREPPPAELEDQSVAALGLCRACGWWAGAVDGYEADDILGALCARLVDRAGRARVRATVVTSDKDLAQLVSDRVTWLDARKGERYGPREVEARLGVAPGQVVDLLALAGDPVDNIPGVPGIGAKTALRLLELFGSLERTLERLDELPSSGLRGAARLAGLLDEHRDQALLSRRLATVEREVEGATPALEALRIGPPDATAVREWCDRLGFESLRDRLLAGVIR